MPVAVVLCSSAIRARQTLDLVSAPGTIRIERELYGATPAELLERLASGGESLCRGAWLRGLSRLREGRSSPAGSAGYSGRKLAALVRSVSVWML